jgi:DNA-binding response OmpR family regulator
MTKPFSMRELVARVRTLLRRVDRAHELAGAAVAVDAAAARLVVGPVRIDRDQRRVHRAGAEIHLTPTEFDLLLALASRPRTVLTRERLLAEVWGWQDASGTRTVDSHVKALRRKLGSDLHPYGPRRRLRARGRRGLTCARSTDSAPSRSSSACSSSPRAARPRS